MTLAALHHAPLSFQPVAHSGHYTGRQTAARVGLSYERFRKVRETWTRDRDFPAEINEPGEPVRYLAEAVERWLVRRTQRVHAPAPVPELRAVPSAAGREGRASLRAIKGRL
ncbi:hypothetical protein ACETK8_15925 [Brevundimonas staleyi]|uniref:AlpA family phage regulatory protein n=1 Tax=Brevundimonas staleyi TaxID=74326 RepID=A0ABW0FXF6_9CAUL